MRLDAKTVSSLRLDGKTDVIFFDDDLPGFGYRLRLGANGKVRKSWIAQYRRAGNSRRLLLGAGDVLSSERARGMAKKALAVVALGGDPQQDRADRRSQDRVSLKSMIEEFLRQAQVRPSTMREQKRYLLTGNYIRPMHSMPIDAVTRRDVAAQLLVVSREHGPVVAGAARAKLGAFFRWAMQSGLVEHNPVIGTAEPKKNAPRERVLDDIELSSIWNAAGNDAYGKIVRLLILLGARRQEIGGIAWSEIDTEAGVWTLPAARSKNKRAHAVPLMPLALGIIKSVPQLVSRDSLFGTRSSNGFCDWGPCKDALDLRSGVTGWTLHDIRRSVATGMANLSVQPHVIEAVLGHVGHKAGVAGVYNRSSYERETKQALMLWEDHVRTLVEGGERKILVLPREA